MDYAMSDTSNSGNIVILYNLTSLAACCSACYEFQESLYYSWIQSPVPSFSYSYQYCFCKNANVKLYANSSVSSGSTGRTQPLRSGACNTIINNTDYDNGYLATASTPSITGCCSLCQNYSTCNYFTYASGQCYLKGINSNKVTNNGATVGSVVTARTVPLRTGKRGIAWFNSLSCSDLKLLTNVAWIYNWNSQPDAAILQCINDLGMEYIPMQYDLPLELQDIYLPSAHLLGYNEPNFAQEANILPAAAAQSWAQIQAYAIQNNLLLGSPSAAAGGYIETVPWFDQFFGNCTLLYGSAGCKVDYITTHIYNCVASEVWGYLNTTKKYNKPIWLTEVACPAEGMTAQAVYNFMQDLLSILENDPAIQRYAWFGTRIAPTDDWLTPLVNIFNNSGAALTSVGQLYTTYPSSGSGATASPTTKPTATPAPTISPSATPSPTIKPSATPAPTIKPSASPAPTIKSSTTTGSASTPSPTPKAATPNPTSPPSTKPTSSPTKAPTAAPSNGYEGCFVDNVNTRDLPVQGPQFNSGTTVEKCRYWCGERLYTYAGLQYSSECFCGNSYGSQGQAANSDCNMTCAGNAAEMCGQGNRNSIYTSGDVGYKGCYADNANRDLPYQLASSSSMTIDSCRQTCASNNYAYAGLQYAQECWCGPTYGAYGITTTCNMPCSGDSTETCGGGMTNSVFTSMTAAAYPGY